MFSGLKYFLGLKYFFVDIFQYTLQVNQISRESKLIFQRQLGAMRALGLIVWRRSERGTAASINYRFNINPVFTFFSMMQPCLGSIT